MDQSRRAERNVSRNNLCFLECIKFRNSDSSEFLKDFWLFFSNFLLAVIFFFGISANFLVLLVFYRKPGLRTTANRFVIHLMIINIISCVTLLPITLASNSNELMANDFLCYAERFSSIFCSSAIVYSVLLIAIDQYFAVVNPLHYHCIISSWKAYLMILASWGFSFVLALLGAVQPDFEIYRSGISRKCGIRSQFRKKENSFDVSMVESSSSLYEIIFGITHAVAAFLIPFGFICFIYCRICVAASGNSKRARTSILNSEDSPQFPVGKCQSETNDSEIQAVGKSAEGKTMSQSKNDDDREPDESCGFSKNDDRKCTLKPSLVVTRASPPKPLPHASESEVEGDDCLMDFSKPVFIENLISKRESVPEMKEECEMSSLKPTLKNNSSLSKLSSLHIQFSNPTEKIVDRSPTERRHSNVLLVTVDSEFENISKTRSSSMQSSFCEISSRSSISARSTTTTTTTASTQIQSSRSSSLNSTSVSRLPPSRASSIKSTSSYIVHNIRHRISNASLFRYREEARAARISAMVIVMALFCWLPFFVMASFYSEAELEKFPRLPHYLNVFSTVLLLASTIVSPFLFAFRNRKVKKEIRKIFQFCPDFKWDCSKSFYTRNFSMTLKSQAVQLLSETEKNPSPIRETKTLNLNKSGSLS